MTKILKISLAVSIFLGFAQNVFACANENPIIIKFGSQIKWAIIIFLIVLFLLCIYLIKKNREKKVSFVIVIIALVLMICFSIYSSYAIGVYCLQ